MSTFLTSSFQKTIEQEENNNKGLITSRREANTGALFSNVLQFIPENRLVYAATPLFTFLSFSLLSSYPEDISELFHYLVETIKEFQATASQTYETETVLVARYLLCASLDELVLENPDYPSPVLPIYKLLSYFHPQDGPAHHFFTVLERLTRNPLQHIDLLELSYLCLSLGYQEKFPYMKNIINQSGKTMENLYRIIRWHRGEIKKPFAEISNLLIQKNYRPPTVLRKLLLFFIGSLVFSLYVLFNFSLLTYTEPLYKQLLALL